MPDIDRAVDPGEPFACVGGTIDGDRAAALFSDRSLTDRGLDALLWIVGAAVIFGLAWLMGAGDRLPAVVRWSVSGCAGMGMLAFGFLHQFGRWHARRWLRWNGLLAGPYRAVLDERSLAFQASDLALRVGYGLIGPVDRGRSCVRLGFDTTACRSLLLPEADCRPPRTAAQLKAFVRQRRREARRNLPPPQPAVPPLLPLAITEKEDRICVRGPLRQGEFFEAMESEPNAARRNRTNRGIYLWLAVCFFGLVGLMGFGALAGRQFTFEAWMEVGILGVVLFVVALAAIRYRTLRADIRADPDAEVGRLDGWLSPSGIAIGHDQGSTAVTWRACDRVEAGPDGIVAWFWHGYFLVIGRHMFASDDQFDQAAAWIASAREPGP